MKLGIREGIFAALLGAIPLAALFFAFRPHDARCEELAEQVEQRKAKLQKLNRLTGRISNLQDEIAARREALEYFQARLPGEREIDKVIQEIWRLAQANGLNTKGIRTPRSSRNDDDEGGGPKAHAITAELQGDFMGFYTFLQELERQPRIARIREMELAEPDDKEAPNGQVEVTFEITVFFDSGDAP